jgi:hypothetical protein
MRNRVLLPVCAMLALVVAGLAAMPSWADFTAYTNGEPNTTYAHFDNFHLCNGTYPGPFTNADRGNFHPPRIPDVQLTENTGLGLVTGSGNIYAFDVPTDFTALAFSYNKIGFSTRVWLQFRTLGSELDYESITLSYGSGTGTVTLTLNDAVEFVELSREPGQFGGWDVETLVVFDFPYNPRAMRVDFNAAEASMSFDQFRVDSKAYPTP